jgi:flagellar motility protein MotE (MotC chaperone)
VSKKKPNRFGASTRIFAVVGVAAAGLGAIKALDVADRALDIVTLSEPAYAQAEPTSTAEAAAAPDDPRGPLDILNADRREAERQAAEAALVQQAAACEPSDAFADRSGLSLTELQVLRSLSQRRRDLDGREASVVEREGLLAAAEDRVEARIEELRALESKINGMLGQLDEAEEAQINSLVALYSRMKAQDAARIFAALDEEVLIQVASRMTEQSLAPILAEMTDADAASLTVALARRHIAPDTLEALEGGAAGAG